MVLLTGPIVGWYQGMRAYFDPEYRRPLPAPEAAEQWFTKRGMFGRTTPKQKKAILKIVLDEIRKSREAFGFSLEDRHIYKEEWFFLYIVECARGTDAIRAMGFDDVLKHFAVNMDIFFRSTSEYYFKREKGKPGSRLKYRCHMEAVRAGVLNEIFNNGL
ncbi:hypothetical protein A2524_03790 [Candidatus Wolfebacteria bacterium RIFOXYD12_FULL_48_21]|uniref:Uncharacterized protein n=1 Tax=Candidatus Wolfebacteria bacterium RIFOXYD1_FULL_48_65 TaxID=1802561 RepID=A0A1F8E077_9BACT|nr:MAG: hypothetical protein A2610_00730 [Candidatus Wolfebacteria bacterium RIFOXYD1_FULL_48_65]OGM95171.1 MAG: hypothetical protein A2524_03790 [Candidatus Wolfebacteria bacterium RIFOXYD12_FULL_48_21]OGM95741.1 MAG: hypothetical protein A2532_03410 [Candidatus Wolfebacteria bacterium RIFOXYD2_FULL_48_11]